MELMSTVECPKLYLCRFIIQIYINSMLIIIFKYTSLLYNVKKLSNVVMAKCATISINYKYNSRPKHFIINFY